MSANGRTLHTNVVLALFVTMLAWAGSPPESPVADAAMRGEVEHVRSLLRDGADVNAAQGDGMTGLHWASERGDDELASMLILLENYPRALAALDKVESLGDAPTSIHFFRGMIWDKAKEQEA